MTGYIIRLFGCALVLLFGRAWSEKVTWNEALELCDEVNMTLRNIQQGELKEPITKYTLKEYYEIENRNEWLSNVLVYDVIYKPPELVDQKTYRCAAVRFQKNPTNTTGGQLLYNYDISEENCTDNFESACVRESNLDSPYFTTKEHSWSVARDSCTLWTPTTFHIDPEVSRQSVIGSGTLSSAGEIELVSGEVDRYYWIGWVFEMETFDIHKFRHPNGSLTIDRVISKCGHLNLFEAKIEYTYCNKEKRYYTCENDTTEVEVPAKSDVTIDPMTSYPETVTVTMDTTTTPVTIDMPATERLNDRPNIDNDGSWTYIGIGVAGVMVAGCVLALLTIRYRRKGSGLNRMPSGGRRFSKRINTINNETAKPELDETAEYAEIDTDSLHHIRFSKGMRNDCSAEYDQTPRDSFELVRDKNTDLGDTYMTPTKPNPKHAFYNTDFLEILRKHREAKEGVKGQDGGMEYETLVEARVGDAGKAIATISAGDDVNTGASDYDVIGQDRRKRPMTENYNRLDDGNNDRLRNKMAQHGRDKFATYDDAAVTKGRVKSSANQVDYQTEAQNMTYETMTGQLNALYKPDN